MIILMVPLLCAVIVGVVYTWIVTVGDVRKGQIQGWRRTTAWISILAATVQIVLLAAMLLFHSFDRTNMATRSVASPAWTLMWCETVVSVIAFCSALTRTGKTRLWMVFASVSTFGVTGFLYLITGIVF